MRLEWPELGKMANKVARQPTRLIQRTHAVHEPSVPADHSVTTCGTAEPWQII